MSMVNKDYHIDFVFMSADNASIYINRQKIKESDWNVQMMLPVRWRCAENWCNIFLLRRARHQHTHMNCYSAMAPAQ